MIDVVGPQPYL